MQAVGLGDEGLDLREREGGGGGRVAVPAAASPPRRLAATTSHLSYLGHKIQAQVRVLEHGPAAGLGRGRERCAALADREQRSTSTCLELFGLLQ